MPGATGGVSRYVTRNNADYSVVQHFNFGVNLDGSGNPVFEADLKFAGSQRFKQRGAYFNYLVPERVHNRTPCDGINCYSFALHPDSNQPSGTLNFSRIDSPSLNVYVRDPVRAGRNVPLLDLVRDTRVYVFGRATNLLRIGGGTASLRFQS
jgi:hypothetical protein